MGTRVDDEIKKDLEKKWCRWLERQEWKTIYEGLSTKEASIKTIDKFYANMSWNNRAWNER